MKRKSVLTLILVVSGVILCFLSCTEKTGQPDGSGKYGDATGSNDDPDGSFISTAAEPIPGFSVYENRRFNFRIQYPEEWKKMEDITGVSFIVQNQDQKDVSGNAVPMEGFSLLFDRMTGRSMTGEEYKKIVLDGMEKYIKDFRLVSLSETLLDGIKAYEMMYSGTHREISMKYFSLFAIYNGTVYTLAFSAQVDRYDRYSDILKRVTDSFQFLEKKQ